jgi:hypothetical protein
MAADPFTDPGDPYSSPYAKAAKDLDRKGGFGCSHYVVIAISVIAVLLIAAFGFAFFYVWRSVLQSPAEQERLAADLVNWEFNQQLPTLFAYDAFFGRTVVKGDEGKGYMILVHPGIFFSDLKVGSKLNDQQKLEIDFGDQPEAETTILVQTGERVIQLEPYELNLTFNKTRGTTSGSVYWEVTGVFPGKYGPCIGALRLRESVWSDDEIEQIIRKIRLPEGK